MNSVISGIGFGLVLALLPGPVFFGLIQTGIQKGFRYGVFFAIGVAFSDLLLILLTYFGISNFLEGDLFRKVVHLSGGIIMCIFGLYYFFKPIENTVPLEPMQKDYKKGNFIFKGFLLNVLNPAVFFYWISLVSITTVTYQNNAIDVFSFFLALILAVFSMDILKSYLSNKVKRYFTNHLLDRLNKVLGVILFAVGVSLLYSAFNGQAVEMESVLQGV